MATPFRTSAWIPLVLFLLADAVIFTRIQPLQNLAHLGYGPVIFGLIRAQFSTAIVWWALGAQHIGPRMAVAPFFFLPALFVLRYWEPGSWEMRLSLVLLPQVAVGLILGLMLRWILWRFYGEGSKAISDQTDEVALLGAASPGNDSAPQPLRLIHLLMWMTTAAVWMAIVKAMAVRDAPATPWEDFRPYVVPYLLVSASNGMLAIATAWGVLTDGNRLRRGVPLVIAIWFHVLLSGFLPVDPAFYAFALLIHLATLYVMLRLMRDDLVPRPLRSPTTA